MPCEVEQQPCNVQENLAPSRYLARTISWNACKLLLLLLLLLLLCFIFSLLFVVVITIGIISVHVNILIIIIVIIIIIIIIDVQESIKHKELAKHRTAAVMKREQDRAAKGNTLDKITEKFKEGPLLMLRRYYKTSVRLQVVTRHASGVRGTATGNPFLLINYSNKKRKDTPFGVSLMRSQALYWAAQELNEASNRSINQAIHQSI